MRRLISSVSLLALAVVLLAACASQPAPTAVPPNTPTPVVTLDLPTTSSDALVEEFETQVDSRGSVAVDVKPTALAPGRPVSFDIAMNTHSVDLGDDMVKASLLRDDTGKEYTPTAWDGAAAGGHHRAGTLVFGMLSGKPKYVELVLKGIAKVPERVFRWDLTQ